jgi:hypothetical protein
MKLKKSNVVVCALALGAATPALAMPTLFPANKDDLLKVQNKTTSGVIGDTVETGLAWVLPPSAGTAKQNGFVMQSANLGFCQEMADLQDSSHQLVTIIQTLEADYKSKLPELDQKRQAYNDLYAKAAAIVAGNTDIQKIESDVARLSDIESRLDGLYTSSGSCSNPDTCAEINQEIKDL